jgi:hypothetical protein
MPKSLKAFIAHSHSQDALDRAAAEMPGATVITVPTDVSKSAPFHIRRAIVLPEPLLMRAGQVPTHSPGERRKIRGPDRGLRFAHDSLPEGDGFELPVPGHGELCRRAIPRSFPDSPVRKQDASPLQNACPG